MDPSETDRRVNWERRLELDGARWADQTIGDHFRRCVEQSPDKIAVQELHPSIERLPSLKVRDQDRLTYRQLDEKASQYAAGMVDLGIQRGDRVAVQLPNWWQWSALALACQRIGAILVPIVSSNREREVGHILDDSGAKLVVVPSVYREFDFTEMVREIRPDVETLEHVVVVGGTNSGMRSILDLAGGDDLETDGRETRPNDISKIHYTSGTTGRPKGVMQTWNTVCTTMETVSDLYDCDRSTVFHTASPMGHKAGTWSGWLLPIVSQGTVILQDQWEPETFVEAIETEGINVSMGSTPFLKDTTDASKVASTDLSSLRVFISGGAPIPRVVARQAREKLACSVISVWGMTETNIVTSTRLDDAEDKIIETDGRTIPGCDVKVLDEEGQQVFDREGDLFARGIGITVGYWNKPELNESAFDEECWLTTGDRAIMSEDGYIDVVGRSKDIIIRGGENINPLPIEDILLEHPDIDQAVIVGMPDDRLGERPCAYVVPSEPDGEITLADIRSFLDTAGIDRHKYPEYVVNRADLPVTSSGKIRRFKLREDIAERAPDIDR